MIRRICYWLAERLPVLRIQVDGRPYLDRFYIAGREPSSGFPGGMRKRLAWLPFTLYLHRFHRGDADRELHNHPWRAVSLILWGGYREEYRIEEPIRRGGPQSDVVGRRFLVNARTIKPGRLHPFGPHHFHRVSLLREGEAWTLFAVGKRRQGWGFWDRVTGTYTPQEEYLRAGCTMSDGRVLVPRDLLRAERPAGLNGGRVDRRG